MMRVEFLLNTLFNFIVVLQVFRTANFKFRGTKTDANSFDSLDQKQMIDLFEMKRIGDNFFDSLHRNQMVF